MKQNIDPTINLRSRNIKFWLNSAHLLSSYVSHNITTLETPRTSWWRYPDCLQYLGLSRRRSRLWWWRRRRGKACVWKSNNVAHVSNKDRLKRTFTWQWQLRVERSSRHDPRFQQMDADCWVGFLMILRLYEDVLQQELYFTLTGSAFKTYQERGSHFLYHGGGGVPQFLPKSLPSYSWNL